MYFRNSSGSIFPTYDNQSFGKCMESRSNHSQNSEKSVIKVCTWQNHYYYIQIILKICGVWNVICVPPHNFEQHCFYYVLNSICYFCRLCLLESKSNEEGDKDTLSSLLQPLVTPLCQSLGKYWKTQYCLRTIPFKEDVGVSLTHSPFPNILQLIITPRHSIIHLFGNNPPIGIHWPPLSLPLEFIGTPSPHPKKVWITLTENCFLYEFLIETFRSHRMV